jgi:DNA-binding SARP family transcriptional activator
MEYRVLGPLEVSERGRAVAIGTGKRRSLLALLLLHANEVVPGERLIDELWGERPPATAANALQVYVYQLRKELGARSGQLLLRRANGYVLEVSRGDFDATRFEDGVVAAERALAAGEPRWAEEMLRAALSLWRGPPLADFTYEPFAQGEIARLEELRLTALEQRIEADLALGRHGQIVGELEALVGAHPLRERMRGQWMLALYRSGRQAEALAVYRDGRRLMTEDLGIEPGHELRGLESKILAQSPDLTPPPQPRARGRDQAAVTALHAAGAPAPDAPDSRAPPRTLVRRRGPVAALLAASLIVAAAGFAALTHGGRKPADTVPALDLASNAIAAVDGASGAVRLTVPLVGRATDLAAAEDTLWAATVNSASLTAVDARSRTIARVVPLRIAPAAVAVGQGAVWVADGRRGVVVAVREGYDKVSAPIRFARGRRPTGAATDATSMAVGGGSVWVTDGSAKLARVDARTRRVVAIAAGRPLTDITVGAGAVWAISATERSVLRIDPETNSVTERLRLARAGEAAPVPAAIAATADSVWVLNRNTASVTRIDAGSRAIVAVIPIGTERAPNEIATGPRTVWVANDDGTLSRIDAATNSVSSIRIGEALREVAVDASRVWVGTTALDQELPGAAG